MARKPKKARSTRRPGRKSRPSSFPAPAKRSNKRKNISSKRRSKRAAKSKQTKRVRRVKPRPTKRPAPRAAARTRKRNKRSASRRVAKSDRKRVLRRPVRAVRRKPRAKIVRAGRREREKRLEKQLAESRQEVRGLKRAVEEFTRVPIARSRQIRLEGELRDEPLNVPEGATNIVYDDEGDIESFDLPRYIGEEWSDIDFDDFDWDDIFDDVGDEDEDMYGEDSAK